MSIAVLSRPPDLSPPRVPVEDDRPVDRLGEYSVGDPAFVRQAAAALMQQCVLHDAELPPPIAAALRLMNGDRHAIGMADALLALDDLEERRAVLCQIVHAIVALKRASLSPPFPLSHMSTGASLSPADAPLTQEQPNVVSLLTALRHIRDTSKSGLNALAPELGMSLGNNAIGAHDCVRRQVDGTQVMTIRRIEELCEKHGRPVRVDMGLVDDL